MPTLVSTRLSDAVEVLDITNTSASARISLYGGQVLSFKPRHDNRERLYLSNLARLDGSKSIRGGIPVCWPWFGAHHDNPALPAHGFARNRLWQLEDYSENADRTSLILKCSDTHGPGLEAELELFLHVTVGATLQLGLLTRNRGSLSCNLRCALHTYFAVPDIEETTLAGLHGRYADKVRNFDSFDTPEPYAFNAETDRIHLEPVPEIAISTSDSVTRVVSSGHDSIVVWNPWTACADNFPDMAPGDYRRMLCVESAVTRGLTLAAGAVHILRQEIC